MDYFVGKYLDSHLEFYLPVDKVESLSLIQDEFAYDKIDDITKQVYHIKIDGKLIKVYELNVIKG